MIKNYFPIFLIASFIGCATLSPSSPSSDSKINAGKPRSKGRVITLDNVPKQTGDKIKLVNGLPIPVNEIGGITSWACRDYINEEKLLIEPGYFTDPESRPAGFILLDGSDSGTFAFYMRDGINHRWDWAIEENSYSFVIKPDGKGLYYSFKGKKTAQSADDVFKCEPR